MIKVKIKPWHKSESGNSFKSPFQYGTLQPEPTGGKSEKRDYDNFRVLLILFSWTLLTFSVPFSSPSRLDNEWFKGNQYECFCQEALVITYYCIKWWDYWWEVIMTVKNNNNHNLAYVTDTHYGCDISAEPFVLHKQGEKLSLSELDLSARKPQGFTRPMISNQNI